LAAHNIKVIRFWNNDIFTNLEGVLERILDELTNRKHQLACIQALEPPLCLSPAGREQTFLPPEWGERRGQEWPAPKRGRS
jgi:hypothetical protein